MKHPMKKIDYLECRDNKYTLIAFRDGRRVITYGGLPTHRVVEETLAYTNNGCVVKVFANGSAPTTNSRDIADY